jgi:hypothetical protein
MLLLILMQASAPDIELNARVRVREVTIEQKGDARLTVTTEPDGGNLVDVRAPGANGQRRLRNVEVNVRAEARIAAPDQARDTPPSNNPEQPETSPPQ